MPRRPSCRPHARKRFQQQLRARIKGFCGSSRGYAMSSKGSATALLLWLHERLDTFRPCASAFTLRLKLSWWKNRRRPRLKLFGDGQLSDPKAASPLSLPRWGIFNLWGCWQTNRKRNETGAKQIKSLLRTELSVVASLDLKVYFDLVNRSDKTTWLPGPFNLTELLTRRRI